MLHLVLLNFKLFSPLSSAYIIFQTCSKPLLPSKFASAAEFTSISVLFQGNHENIFSSLEIWLAFDPVGSFQKPSHSAQLNIHCVSIVVSCSPYSFANALLTARQFTKTITKLLVQYILLNNPTFDLSGFLPSGFAIFLKTALYFLCISNWNWRREKEQQKHAHLKKKKKKEEKGR